MAGFSVFVLSFTNIFASKNQFDEATAGFSVFVLSFTNIFASKISLKLWRDFLNLFYPSPTYLPQKSV
jgi:hypothetical protein